MNNHVTSNAEKEDLSVPDYQKQLDLFMIPENADAELTDIQSNILGYWDVIPKFRLSSNMSESERKKVARTEHTFFIGSQAYKIEITPAVIDRKTVVDGKEVIEHVNAYMGEKEELVLDALRKMAADNKNIYISDDGKIKKFGLRFTLYALQKELENHNHKFNYPQLKESLNILAGSMISLSWENQLPDGKYAENNSKMHPIELEMVELDDKTYYQVIFSSKISADIFSERFKRYNYSKSMRYTSPIARFIYKTLALKWSAAKEGEENYKFSMNRVLGDCYVSETRVNRRKALIDKAIEELKKDDVLSSSRLANKKTGRKIDDIVFHLQPHKKFVTETIRRNKGVSLITGKVSGLDNINPTEIWNEICAKASFDKEVYNTWLKELKVLEINSDKELIIQAPTRLYKTYVTENCLDKLLNNSEYQIKII